MRETRPTLPSSEVQAQQGFAQAVRSLSGRPATYHIVTYGCQMNAHDSEQLAGLLESMGLTAVPDQGQAGLVLYNTCCIRDNAQRRALGNVTWLKELKKKKPEMIICVSGCMMQQQGMADMMLSKYPFVDVAFGTHNLYRFPELLYQALMEKRQTVEVLESDGCVVEGLPVRRESPFKAYITIMYGCNNFCSFCIVPYVRGRERSRRPEDILAEAAQLRDDGVQEITLLGQNVNSYGLDAPEGWTFARLLRELDAIGIPRIRFMTSHPKDLSNELIAAMAEGRHICPAFHLPVQSGSDGILAAMNRRYTRDRYLERLDALRQAIPDISVTTDLIVAFPGESDADFEQTLSLVEEAEFDAAFTFIFSPREGTRAATMPGAIDPAEATRRIELLIERQKAITARRLRRFLGTTQEVLVEETSRRDEQQVAGKTPQGIHVNFSGDPSLIGKMIRVRIESAGENTLRGSRIEGGNPHE